MTQPCDNCGQPSATPTCDKCLGYQAWASDSGNPRPDSGKRHDQRVRDTRKHLSELPDLYAQLGLFTLPGSTPPDPDQRSGKSNPSHRCVVNLDVLDLTDARLKDDAEVTRTDYDLDRRAGARRQGIVQTLASWSRLVHEEREAEYGDDESIPADLVELSEDPTVISECGYLLEYLDWIGEQPWFNEHHDDVQRMWADVRRVIGERDHRDMFCRYCQNRVHPVDQMYEPTSWDACAFGLCEGCKHPYAIGPELAALGRVQESVTLDTVSKTLGIPLPTLYRWLKLGVFQPAPESPKKPSNRRPAVFDLATVREKTKLVRSA